MPYIHRIIIYFDGASKYNPRGPAGCGFTIRRMNRYGGDGKLIASGWSYLGHNISNNQAEYHGLVQALTALLEKEYKCYGLYIRGDSQLVINQLKGIYKVRSSNMQPCYLDACAKIRNIPKIFVKYSHIDRTRNKDADHLANRAIERGNSYAAYNRVLNE